MYEKILTEYQKREPRLLYSYELETFLKHMQASHVTEEQLAKIPKMWKAYINMQGYFGDATVALADFIKDFNRNWKDSQPLDAGICYIYFDTEADTFKLEKSCLGQDFIFCQSLEEGKKLLERLYYKYNIINIWGERTADNLEFGTSKEAADFAKWLRRPNGAYDSEHVVNSGASLVSHGFQDWITKQKAE